MQYVNIFIPFVYTFVQVIHISASSKEYLRMFSTVYTDLLYRSLSYNYLSVVENYDELWFLCISTTYGSPWKEYLDPKTSWNLLYSLYKYPCKSSLPQLQVKAACITVF